MKGTYTAPKLSSFGNVTEITQIIGGATRADFTFNNGSVISDNNDLGSDDLTCTGTVPNLNCTVTD